jgi:uncharacterized membrane protein YoaK (UPF0700 family)
LTLAACAGAVDLLAFAALGGAFASIVTGNLVVTGYRLGTADASQAAAPAVAVGGYAAGVAAWQWPWLRRTGIVAPLLAELAVLLVVAAGWWIAETRPGRAVSLHCSDSHQSRWAAKASRQHACMSQRHT